MSLIFWLQGASNIFTIGNVVGLLGLITLIGGSILILKSRAREEAHASTALLLKRTQETLAQVEHELDLEKAKVRARDETIAEITEERDDLDTAYKALGGTTLSEVVTFVKDVISDVRYVNGINIEKNRIAGDLLRLQSQISKEAAKDV